MARTTGSDNSGGTRIRWGAGDSGTLAAIQRLIEFAAKPAVCASSVAFAVGLGLGLWLSKPSPKPTASTVINAEVVQMGDSLNNEIRETAAQNVRYTRETGQIVPSGHIAIHDNGRWRLLQIGTRP